ncbi:MAG: hypothetical protein KBS57_02840, partial [Alistipes sp.]|nr:hypothetical protein [Candidatus Minthomonas equi]
VLLSQITPSGFYRLDGDFLNKYFIVSSPGTRKLMASPEVIGLDAYRAMVPVTIDALHYLKDRDSRSLDRVNILTILRGGLNYPLEESCFECGITVSDMSFLSCERVIENGFITGLEVKYEKLHTEKDAVIMIGDIIASGATLRHCLKYVFDAFKVAGHNIRKFIFFTVGGTKAIKMMEEFTVKFREQWPGFEGFECVFYEGVFTVWEDNGVTGESTPDIDFGWNGGVVSPEFREYVMDYAYAPALLEKCIIYDGGARRYNIGSHVEEVIDFWERLEAAAERVPYADFLAEKFGYPAGVTYRKWLEYLHYPADRDLSGLYEKEMKYASRLLEKPLVEICRERLSQLKYDFSKYIIHQ